MQTASAELTAANRTMIQAPPHSRRPRSKIWSALVKFLTLSVPVADEDAPVHEHVEDRDEDRRADDRERQVALRVLRLLAQRRDRLEAGEGEDREDDAEVQAVAARDVARVEGVTLKPPGPGETRPEITSARKTPTSTAASVSIDLHRQRDPEQRERRHADDEDDEDDPPRDVPAVLRLQRVVHERAGERADRRRSRPGRTGSRATS